MYVSFTQKYDTWHVHLLVFFACIVIFWMDDGRIDEMNRQFPSLATKTTLTKIIKNMQHSSPDHLIAREIVQQKKTTH